MAIRTVTDVQWKNLIQETLFTALSILETVDVLVNHMNQRFSVKNNVPIMCTALYTHVVEEYGKILYLQSLIPQNGKVDIEYDSKFKNHKIKFPLALQKLPTSCTVLDVGSFTNSGFTNSGFTTATLADWETRLDIFNTNFDNNGNVIKYPTIDVNRLKQAVFDLRTELYSVIV